MLSVGAYLTNLKLEDLALATACADGNDDAWDHVMRELRPALYRAADAIDPTGGGPRGGRRALGRVCTA